jgi:choline-sulfatase
MADEHTRRILGCYGDRIVKTPHLDFLASRGTRFTQAYTPSPVCAPARASTATGLWVHQHGFWSCAEVYDGTVPSWGHRLINVGHRIVSVGKLHYRSSDQFNGFDPEILPEHAFRGYGWVKGLVRDQPLPSFEEGTTEFAYQIGRGDSENTRYDQNVCDAACNWLNEVGSKHHDKPWVLFVSFVCPHYPLIAPDDFYELYRFDQIGWPHKYRESPSHPVLKELYSFFNYQDHLSDDDTKIAVVAYYALCSYVDHLVGRLLTTLNTLGLDKNTRIIYTSDHGEMLGSHGMWTKQLMFEDSVGIPLLMAGPGIPNGRVVDTPVSLVDIYPTLIECSGEKLSKQELNLPGRNLVSIANGDIPNRHIISEYHDGGAITGMFMIIVDRWKYIHYAGHSPQLFNLDKDPTEDHDLASHPEFADVLRHCENTLRSILSPEEVTKRVFQDQRARVVSLGGREVVLNMESEPRYERKERRA